MQDDNKYYATMCGFWFNPDKVEITKPFVKEIKIDKDPEPIDLKKLQEEIDSVLVCSMDDFKKASFAPKPNMGESKGWAPTKKNSSLDIAAKMAKEKTNTQKHYKGKDSLYKFCEEWSLNTYEFDILKRIVRCRHKGNFAEDLDKTIDLIKIYKKEQKDLHGK